MWDFIYIYDIDENVDMFFRYAYMNKQTVLNSLNNYRNKSSFLIKLYYENGMRKKIKKIGIKCKSYRFEKPKLV